MFLLLYSVLSAITGSFFDADFAGIKPPINVNIMLNITNATVFDIFSTAFNGIFPVK